MKENNIKPEDWHSIGFQLGRGVTCASGLASLAASSPQGGSARQTPKHREAGAADLPARGRLERHAVKKPLKARHWI